MKLCALLAIRHAFANISVTWRGIFEGLSRDRGRTTLAENLRAFSLIKAFKLIPLLGRFISVDSTFKAPHL
jgi:hypothetical protein